MLYFLIPFMLAITIMGTRELWLNVVQPWRERERRKAEAALEAEAVPTSGTVTPLKRRAKA